MRLKEKQKKEKMDSSTLIDHLSSLEDIFFQKLILGMQTKDDMETKVATISLGNQKINLKLPFVLIPGISNSSGDNLLKDSVRLLKKFAYLRLFFSAIEDSAILSLPENPHTGDMNIY